MTERANKARIEAESRLHVAEREREIYRLLSLRYKNRLDEASGARGDDEEYTEHLVAGLLLEARDGPVFGVGNLFQRFRNRLLAAERDGNHQDSDDDDEDEQDDDDDSEMEEDQDDESAEEEEEDIEDTDAASDDDADMGTSMSDARVFKHRLKQPRTISMSDDDL